MLLLVIFFFMYYVWHYCTFFYKQMELEKIRQSDSEVRWQHDEDVLECNSCKKTFQNRKEKVSLYRIDSLVVHEFILLICM